MLESLQSFTQSLPEWLQWFGVMVIGAIPFLEGFLATVTGIIVGVWPPIAIAAAIAGNMIAIFVCVLLADTIRSRFINDDHKGNEEKTQRLHVLFEKYGTPGVTLVGNFIIPSHLVAVALIGFGVSRERVLIWQFISITLLAAVFGTLTAFGVDFLSN